MWGTLKKAGSSWGKFLYLLINAYFRLKLCENSKIPVNKASANLYSLIETAKASGLEPYAYLRYLFTELPKAKTVEAIEALLPSNIDNDQIRVG